MKNLNLLTAVGVFAICFALFAFIQPKNTSENFGNHEFTSFTVVESIIPAGLGRSRLISSLETRDYKEFTSVKSSEDNSRNKSDRDEIRVYNYEETKLLNFYNLVGIRFQNIAANDAIINNKVTTMLNEGWELVNIVAGIESDAGKEDGNGIYLTRFYFKRTK